MSNDLISRRALTEALIEIFQGTDDMYIAGRVIGLVDAQPTAYDPDYVAKTLIDKCEADKKFCRTNHNLYFEGRISAFDIAVYLVAKGGVADEKGKD